MLSANDIDEAKRHLDTIELSTMSPNTLFNNTRLDHSAGSLLDPVNVSAESTDDEIERYVAHHAIVFTVFVSLIYRFCVNLYVK